MTAPENAYLVGLRLAGRKVVVVGGGSVAQRRLPLLVASGADVHVISRSATRAVEAMSGITLSLREYRDGDLDGAWYAIAATDDRAGERRDRRRSRPQPDLLRPRRHRGRGQRGDARVVRVRRAVGRRARRWRAPSLGGHPIGHPRGAAAGRDLAGELREQRRRPRRCGAGRRRARRPRADHRAGPAAARPGRRRGRRPAGPTRTARRAGAERRGDRRGQDPVRPRHGPGRDQRGDDRAGPRRSLRGAAQRGRPVRLRAGLRGSAGVRRRRGSR